jgi:hypothetical protein
MGIEALAIPVFIAALAAIAFRLHRTSLSSGRPAIAEGEPEQDTRPLTHVWVEGDDDDIARWMWRNLVPPEGQSLTVQGELLRAVVRLRNEAQGNGNINWHEGFEKFVDFLHLHLVERSTLSQEARLWVLSALSRLSKIAVRSLNCPV